MVKGTRTIRWTAPLLVAVACGSAGGRGAKGTDGPRDLAAYAGPELELFDDRIDPVAVGVADVAMHARTDPMLRKRAQHADVVARMRVSTVTVDAVNGEPVYHVTLQLAEAPMVQHRPFESRVDLAIRQQSPSFGLVKWLDTRIIGKVFVGYLRQFAGPEEAELHFHLSPDDAEVAAAVRDARALDELQGRR
jgi:hypothetical protein